MVNAGVYTFKVPCKIGLVFAYVAARDMQAKLARALIVIYLLALLTKISS